MQCLVIAYNGEESEKEYTYICFVCTCVCQSLSLVSLDLFMIPWTVAHQAPLSMAFSRQESWSGLPFPSPYIYTSTHTHTYITVNHFAVYPKLTQLCKSTILNYKYKYIIKILKRKRILL